MTNGWDRRLSPAVAARLARLNPPAYLEHKRVRIDGHVAAAARLPDRWDVVEIGSNRGAFSAGLARANPDWTILALEWRQKWVKMTVASAVERGLGNLHCRRADARIALPILAPPGSIERLLVLYPDPWWKHRHAHRRLLDTAFREVATELLAPSGLLGLKTDVRLVRDAVLSDSRAIGQLRTLAPREWPDEREWPLSTRERACLRQGIATYRLFWRKG